MDTLNFLAGRLPGGEVVTDAEVPRERGHRLDQDQTVNPGVRRP